MLNCLGINYEQCLLSVRKGVHANLPESTTRATLPTVCVMLALRAIHIVLHDCLTWDNASTLTVSLFCPLQSQPKLCKSNSMCHHGLTAPSRTMKGGWH